MKSVFQSENTFHFSLILPYFFQTSQYKLSSFTHSKYYFQTNKDFILWEKESL